MALSKINKGKTGAPSFNAWYNPALSSRRKSRLNQKIETGVFMGYLTGKTQNWFTRKQGWAFQKKEIHIFRKKRKENTVIFTTEKITFATAFLEANVFFY